MTSRLHPRAFALPHLLLAMLALVFATACQAQFKVIGSDGKVTYTDREPNGGDAKVIALGAHGAASAAAADSGVELPFELREAASKYPVTLYVTANACAPCVAGRQLLKQRGIPFSERLVVTAEDSEALQRLSGAREAPTLTIGTQTLRGLSSEVWNSYLDAAGYPRQSRLPVGYRYPAAAPIVEQQSPPATTARADAGPSARGLPTAPAPTAPGGIRF